MRRYVRLPGGVKCSALALCKASLRCLSTLRRLSPHPYRTTRLFTHNAQGAEEREGLGTKLVLPRIDIAFYVIYTAIDSCRGLKSSFFFWNINFFLHIIYILYNYIKHMILICIYSGTWPLELARSMLSPVMEGLAGLWWSEILEGT